MRNAYPHARGVMVAGLALARRTASSAGYGLNRLMYPSYCRFGS
jgi:hypothetical protein